MAERVRRPTAEMVRALAEQIRQLETARRPSSGLVTSGSPALDRILPEQGFCRGTIVEWLTSGPGSGGVTLALAAAREATREGGALVVLDGERAFYPPAAARLGIDLQNLIVVRATSEQDKAWAVDQVLRCPAVAAVLCWPGKWQDHTFRRLQLAAEAGGVLGLLVRDQRVRGDPSWAELRLLVQPLANPGWNPQTAPHRRLRVELLRCRGGAAGGQVDLEIDERTGAIDEKSTVHLVPRLAAPAARRRSKGA